MEHAASSDELGEQRRDVQRPVGQARRPLAREPEHERRPDRMPGGDDPQGDAPEPERAPRVLVEAADHDPGRDGERNEPHREHEQHRHENQLRRHCGAGPDLEVEPERGCVRTDQDEHREDAGAPLGRDEHRHQQGDRDEASGEDDERQELPPREALKAPGAALLDDALLVWVEEGGAGSVGRSGHRGEDIVLERRSLDAPGRRFTRTRDGERPSATRKGDAAPP